MSYFLIVFIRGNWTKIKMFTTEENAQSFIDKYPRFGEELSIPIRRGDWQIIKEEVTA
jgi:hypothetical protein